MACTVSERVRTVEFASLVLSEVDPNSSAYPYPPLSLSSSVQSLEIEIVDLENEFLRVTVAPSLGGRLLELFDKRTQISIIRPAKRLNLVQGGSRGVISPFGLQLTLDGTERLTALAPVQWSSRVDEEAGGASITLFEGGIWPISYHLTFELMEQTGELRLSAKLFNRSLQLAHYNAGLLFAPEATPRQVDDVFLFSAEEGSGWFLSSPDLNHIYRGSATRFDRKRVMGPRQLDSWTASLIPVQRASPHIRFGSNVSVSIDGAQVTVESSEGRLEHANAQLKLLVHSATGETLEATVSPSAEAPLQVSLREQDVPIRSVAVIDSSRQALIPPAEMQEAPIASQASFLPDEEFYSIPNLNSTRQELSSFAFEVRTRSLAHLIKSVKAIGELDWEQAATAIEESLLFNGEDALAWWLKTRCERMRADSDGGEELLNAHYLAPMEPMLRVEALLNQTEQPADGPNPILEIYAEDRDVAVATCCELLQVGLYTDAMRLISDWRRLFDFPMLRYLLSYSFLKTSKMTIEAAEQVRAASMMARSGPYPIRPIELSALTEISDRWPDDSQLGWYRQLAEVAASRSL